MKVELYSLDDETFEDAKVGEITLQDEKFSADTKTAKRVLQQPIILFDESVSADDDPEKFMNGLQHQYKSYALRATEPKIDLVTSSHAATFANDRASGETGSGQDSRDIIL